MNPCECTDTKQMVICALNRGDGPCITTAAPVGNPTPASNDTPEPPALNSDTLTNSIAAKLGATIN